MAASEHERRRFVTRHDVEDAAAAGRPLRVGGRDLLTDEAAQRARDLGVHVEREAGPGGTGGRGGGASGASGEVSQDALRRAVRAAVVAELRSEPPGLDAAIDRVLQRRR